jgi:superfamily I DNA/RNA helicase
MVGEKLLMNDPYAYSAKQILTRNEEIEVLNVYTKVRNIETHDGQGNRSNTGVTVYIAYVQWWENNSKKVADIPILHEQSKGEYTKLLDTLKNAAIQAAPTRRTSMWKQYYTIAELFAQVKYNYAVTAHTSQGSTYDHCLVLKWDIDFNRKIEERNRILYVACTRARNILYIEP